MIRNTSLIICVFGVAHVAPAENDPGDAKFAVQLIIAGKYSKAVVEYGKIAEFEQRDASASSGYHVTLCTALEIYYLCAKAEALALNGQMQEANSALFAAESISDGSRDVHGYTTEDGVRVALSCTKGFLAEKRGDFNEAARLYRNSPSNYGNARLALFAVADNRLDEAKTLAKPADLPTEQIVLGLVAAKEGRPADAQTWFNKARKQREVIVRSEYLPICWCEAPPH